MTADDAAHDTGGSHVVLNLTESEAAELYSLVEHESHVMAQAEEKNRWEPIRQKLEAAL